MKKEYLIQVTVPRCPICQSAIRLQSGKYDMYYLCKACDTRFTVVDEGQSSSELLVEAERENENE